MYSKPYLTIDQQVELLRSRGMLLDDEAKAREYLQRIGYYRLSAYWHPLRSRNAKTQEVLDTFKPATTFSMATDLYAFDKGLRLIALDALERIEVSLRTEIALTVGRHSPKAHRDPSTFDARFVAPRTDKHGNPRDSKHKEWLSRLDSRAIESKDEFANHFRTKYAGDHMPIWMAVELLDFGPLSMVLSGLAHSDLDLVCKSYGGLMRVDIKTWAWAMSFTRNVCAHHSRLWNRPLIAQPRIAGRALHPHLAHIHRAPGYNTRFYAVAAVMKHLLASVNPRTNWGNRFTDHIAGFPYQTGLSLKSAGFPDNWQDEPLWS